MKIFHLKQSAYMLKASSGLVLLVNSTVLSPKRPWKHQATASKNCLNFTVLKARLPFTMCELWNFGTDLSYTTSCDKKKKIQVVPGCEFYSRFRQIRPIESERKAHIAIWYKVVKYCGLTFQHPSGN